MSIVQECISTGNGLQQKSLSQCNWARALPGDDETRPVCVYETSKALVAAGLSVIPIEAYEGSKGPDAYRMPHPHDPLTGRIKPSWSIFKMRRPRPEELQGWYEQQGPYGLAVIGGAASGGQYGFGLEVIDLDTFDLVGPWQEAVERKVPGLVNRLVRVKTPRPGLHAYYRCPVYGVNQKLACAPATDDHGNPALKPSGQPIRKTLIEVKAEGGYCLIPPSPRRCHPTNRLYHYVEGSPELTAVPTITPAERVVLLEAARSLNQWQESRRAAPMCKSARNASDLSLPGNDFNARGNWSVVLEPHGWTVTSVYGEETRWCRPGKAGATSATTNHAGTDLLHVFTASSDHFEQDGSYTKFHAYAILNHDGNFQEAARELRAQGYGQPGLKIARR